MFGFLKPLVRWFRGQPRPQDIPEAAPPTPDDKRVFLHGSNFDHHASYRGPTAEQLLERMNEDLLATLPVLQQHAQLSATGTGMDSADLDGEFINAQDMGGGMVNGDGNGGRALMNQGAPNISGAIVGFFLRQTFIGHQLSALLAQHWLIAKCCWMPAQDAIRNGYKVTTPTGDDEQGLELQAAFKAVDERMKLHDNLRNFIGFGKTFGVRVAIFLVDSDDPDFYEYPFNIDAVTPGSYRGISLVDPYWCVPELDAAAVQDPASMHFYEPTWWQINGKRYHRSHLAIYREGDVADILKPSYLYGGIPVPQRVVERVYAAERTANEAPELAMCKRLITLKTDMAETLAAGPEGLAKLQEWVDRMNNYGVKLVDQQDDVQSHETSLADFDALTMTQYQLVAAAAEVPATKLLGTSPKGFGASGDYEIESYHETLETLQSKCTPLVRRHHLLAMKSEIEPRMRGKYPGWVVPSLDLTWCPLDTPTAKEIADINVANSTAALNYVNIGALDGVDVRDNLIANPDSGFAGIPGAYRPGEEVGPGEIPAPTPPGAQPQEDPYATA